MSEATLVTFIVLLSIILALVVIALIAQVKEAARWEEKASYWYMRYLNEKATKS